MVVAASRTSRNDIFSTSLSLPPLLPPGVLPASPACTTPPIPLKSPRLPTSSPSFAHYFDDTHIEVDIDTAAREPIVPSKNIELRLSPHHRLGNGRHAAVQLGAYRLVKGKEREDPSYASHTYDGRHGRGDSADSVEKNWKVCAGKRFSPDAESQIAGLSEAAMLLRLKDCENILKFIGLKDERDEEVAGPSKHATAAGAARGVALASRLAKPKLEHIVTGSTASFNGPDSRSLPPSPLAATSPATPTLGLAAIALNDIHEDDKPLAALASVRRSSTLGSRNSLSSLRDATPKSAREAVDSNGADAAPRLVLLTEYCALGNLATFTQHHGPVHLGRALFFKFAIDLMRAIEACHAKNVIHGDVKPHNCMIDGRLNIKLGDFSSSVFDSPALLDGIALGTTQYSPPELIKPPPSPFSFPVDIFSAGLTLLYMLTGVEPYESLAASSTRTSHGYASPAQSFTPTMNSGAGGCGTPTSSLSRSGSLKKRASLRKKRVRTSSGAGKMVELHLHLAKGHAWEWEERRRLDELEDEGVDEMVSFTSSNGFSAPTWSQEAEVEADETSTLRGEEAEQHYTLALPTLAFSGLPDDLEYPTSMVIPEHLREKAPQPEPVESLSHSRQRSRSISMMYSDGFTPKQTFLDGSGTVPESLRDLIKQMLSPQAADRPSAAAALHRLEQLRQN